MKRICKNTKGALFIGISLRLLISLPQLAYSAQPTEVVLWGSDPYGYGVTNVPLGLSNVIHIAAGESHNLALKDNGTVVAWGDNFIGQVNVPANLSNVVAIAAARAQSAALRQDGTVVTWPGKTQVPQGFSNVVAIAVGDGFTMTLRNDGTVNVFGSNGYGLTNVPAGATNVIAIAAGMNDCLALRQDGKVIEWGNCGWYVKSNIAVVDVAANAWYTIGLSADGQVYRGRALLPFSNVVAISSGLGSHYAIKSDGTVSRFYYDTIYSNETEHLRNVIEVKGGNYHSIALIGNGQPMIHHHPISRTASAASSVIFSVHASGSGKMSYQWLFNNHEIPDANESTLVLTNLQLNQSGNYAVVVGNGLGQLTSSTASLTVDPGPPMLFENPYSRIAYPGQDVLFQVSAGSIDLKYQWQYNGTNIFGATNNSLRLSSVSTNQAGNYSVIVNNPFGAVTSSNATLKVGYLLAWGLQPWERSDITNAVNVTMGEDHTMVLKNDGTVLGWGHYMHWDSGQREYSPVVLPDNLTNIVAIASGWHCTLFLRKDGTVSTAASMAILTNQPPGLTNVISIAGGGANMALKEDGTVIAWGDDSFGGVLTNVPSSLSNVTKIAACGHANLALKGDGTIVGWGSDWYGHTNIPPFMTNVTHIAASSYTALAVTRDGRVVNWGTRSTHGEYWCTNLAEGITNVVDVAAGHFQYLVLLKDGTVRKWFSGGTVPMKAVPMAAGPVNVIAVAASENYDAVLPGTSWLSLPVQMAVTSGSDVGHLRIAIPTVTKRQYTLEYVDSLSATNWTPLKSVDGFGYGVMRSLFDSNVSSQQRFYRIRME